MIENSVVFLQGQKAFYEEKYANALRIFYPLAESGHSEAQCMVGCIYNLGLEVAQNLSEAEKWYLRSSIQGNAVASNNLATLYLNGYGDHASNIEKAQSFYELARQQGFTHAPVVKADGSIES